MGRKRDLDDPLRGVDDSNPNRGHDQGFGEAMENLEADLDSSSALLTRYGFEIKVGLGVLGILAFVFAALVAYRMATSRREEISQAKSPETAQAAGSKESAAGSHPELQGQGEGTSEVATSPPTFSLDFPQSEDTLPQQPAQPPFDASSDGRYAAVSGSAWALPPDDSSGGQSPPGALFTPTESSGFPTNAPAAGSPYAELPPASPVANATNNGLPDHPLSGTSDSLGTDPNNPLFAGAAGSGSVRDFFAEPPTDRDSSEVPRPPAVNNTAGESPPVSQAGATANSSDIGSQVPFPGDFFAGATALSSRSDANTLSPFDQGNAAVRNITPNEQHQLNTGAPSQLGAATTPRPGSFTETQNPTFGGSFASPAPGSASPPSAGPYAPPLVASRSDTASDTTLGDDNYVMYTVQEGETLFDIARQRLGKASRWVDIYQLNRAQLGERLENFRPGLTLRLPAENLRPAAANGGTLR